MSGNGKSDTKPGMNNQPKDNSSEPQKDKKPAEDASKWTGLYQFNGFQANVGYEGAITPEVAKYLADKGHKF